MTAKWNADFQQQQVKNLISNMLQAKKWAETVRAQTWSFGQVR
jgi:hypothetical protein